MPRTDKLGRIRRPEQDATTFQPLELGRVSRSHNVNMTPEAHAKLASLSAVERGDLIQRALAKRQASD